MLKKVRRRFYATSLYPPYVRFVRRAQARRDQLRWRLMDGWQRLTGRPALPPPQLIEFVIGNPSTAWFLHSGRLAAGSISALLQKHGYSINHLESVLDFGCGLGRVMRHWHRHRGPHFHGSDYNPTLIRWCQQNLRFARFAENPLEGPLPYPGGSFDFIYALSVFTHLTEPQQAYWMNELRRVLRRGGHLLISTHGEYYLEQILPESRQKFRAGQCVVQGGEHAGTNICSAYHPPQYVRDHLATEFEIVDFVPKGALGNPWQDYWLLRKPAP